MVKPLNNNVLCEMVKEEKKSVLILVNEDKGRMEKGKVIAVADEVEIVKKGDILYFQSYSLNPVEIDGKELYFIKADDILAKV